MRGISLCFKDLRWDGVFLNGVARRIKNVRNCLQQCLCTNFWIAKFVVVQVLFYKFPFVMFIYKQFDMIDSWSSFFLNFYLHSRTNFLMCVKTYVRHYLVILKKIFYVVTDKKWFLWILEAFENRLHISLIYFFNRDLVLTTWISVFSVGGLWYTAVSPS